MRVYGVPGPWAPVRPRAMRKRLRQTLEHLLDGDSEKQVAASLGLSPHTVHIYVKELYSRFGVVTRAELMARFVPRVRGPVLLELIKGGQLQRRRATVRTWTDFGAGRRVAKGGGGVGDGGGMLSAGVGRGTGRLRGALRKLELRVAGAGPG